MNDNTTIINLKVWCRKFDVSSAEIVGILTKLKDLQLISLSGEQDEKLFISSCEARLNLSRGGKKGGKISRKDKPIVKPTSKPIVKPTPNQKKDKVKIKEIKDKINKDKQLIFNSWLEYRISIKKEILVEATLNSLVVRFNKESLTKVESVVNNSIENGYQGLFWDNYKEQPKKKKFINPCY